MRIPVRGWWKRARLISWAGHAGARLAVARRPAGVMAGPMSSVIGLARSGLSALWGWWLAELSGMLPRPLKRVGRRERRQVVLLLNPDETVVLERTGDRARVVGVVQLGSGCSRRAARGAAATRQPPPAACHDLSQRRARAAQDHQPAACRARRSRAAASLRDGSLDPVPRRGGVFRAADRRHRRAEPADHGRAGGRTEERRRARR